MNLFIDTTNWNLAIVLEKDGEIVDQVIEKQTKKVSDIFITKLNEMLTKNQVTIKEIQNLYVTIGPGSYTGVRVGLLFVKTLKTIDNHYQVHVINSLLFQAGTDSVISVLDARGGKHFVGIYDQTTPLIVEQLVNQEQLDDLVNQLQLKVVQDYQTLDFAHNFLTLKDKFQVVENSDDLQPLYLKSYI